MLRLPKCPNPLPDEMNNLIIKLANLWAKSTIRPKLKKETTEKWDSLLKEWIKYPQLPLLIRKTSNNRGQKVIHESGRILVPTDNSPAHWSFMMAYHEKIPNINEINTYFDEDKIPMAMILSKKEKEKAQFKCTRSHLENPNQFGWKIAHKNPIGLKRAGNIENISLDELTQHFYYFLSPLNMYLVPKRLGGLGELPEFCSAVKDEF